MGSIPLWGPPCSRMRTQPLCRCTPTGKPVVAVSCHPGVIFDTELMRHMFSRPPSKTPAGNAPTSGDATAEKCKRCSVSSSFTKGLQAASVSILVFLMKPLTKTVPQGTATQVCPFGCWL